MDAAPELLLGREQEVLIRGSAWILISTHLPPPVMIESTELRDAVTHMFRCNWAMCFSAAAYSVKAQGRMNLASNTAPVCSMVPSSVAAIHLCTGCRTRF